LQAVILTGFQSDFYLRASVGASASTAALAPPRRIKGAVVAISKNLPFQWRKKGGRWPWPKSIQCFSEKVASLKIK
jgi:hypothetical protein